ncbi:MAG: hypothetical protein Q8N35_09980 [Methylococcaceae bacterium]|nr:hypothetical protein [Methylococcaceae bacterium]MDZ4155931.1 hypothetical protein [Methylococcales bacterium]MDP2392737.1 hypothetical protein [Methylococcaceae bacterium]MDP3019907.1 hypothetical protein [Methylococcaceae bacterium]MDP3389902.1 hypothetical protein [Methylococcaceae bacterium]
MSSYEQSKTARRVASIVFLLVLGVVVGGTLLSEQQKLSSKELSPTSTKTEVQG